MFEILGGQTGAQASRLPSRDSLFQAATETVALQSPSPCAGGVLGVHEMISSIRGSRRTVELG
jgi:hypothetical protein